MSIGDPRVLTLLDIPNQVPHAIKGMEREWRSKD